MERIETDWFSLSPDSIVRSLMGVWFGRWWWILVLPLAVAALASTYDVRFIVVAFMLLLLVYPAVMAVVYFNYALRPLAAQAVFPHRVIFDAEGLVIEYRAPSGAATDKEKKKSNPWFKPYRPFDREKTEEEAALQSERNAQLSLDEVPVPQPVVIARSDIKSITDEGRRLAIRLVSDPDEIVVVPVDAIPADSIAFLLYSYIR